MADPLREQDPKSAEKGLKEKIFSTQLIIEPENPDYIDQVALLADPSGALFMVQEWSGVDALKGDKK